MDHDGKVKNMEETESYERVADKIKFKLDYETFCYRSYLNDCGYDKDEYDVIDKLYNHHVDTTMNKQYPMDYGAWYEEFTGVKIK